jgi:hypothetical protein
MQVCDDIIDAAMEYYENIPTLLRESSFATKNEALNIITKSPIYIRFTVIHRKWIIYLPREITEAIIDFKYSYGDVRRETQRVVRNGKLQEEYVLLGGEPHDAYTNLIQVIRKHIGTDILTPKTLELLSKPANQEKDLWQD